MPAPALATAPAALALGQAGPARVTTVQRTGQQVAVGRVGLGQDLEALEQSGAPGSQLGADARLVERLERPG